MRTQRAHRARVAGSVVVLGGVALAAWLAEVVLHKGWHGLQWLQGYPVAAFVGVLCAAIAVAVAVQLGRPVRLGRLACFVAAAFGVGLVSFELARAGLYALHSRSAFFLMATEDGNAAQTFISYNLGLLAAAALLSAVGLPLAMRLLLPRIRWWTPLLFLAAVLLALPLGVLTIQVVPALDGSTDYLHAVKMGYPVFWTVVLLGAASWLTQRSVAGS